MTITNDLHPLAAEYLERLRSEARTLPRGTRRELLTDIEAHLREATSPDMSQAEALTALDRLGDPHEIVAEHLPDTPAPTEPTRRGALEWAAIFLLLFGGFFFGVGWIAGLVLLWSSAAWTTRDKWLGTLVIPGGLAAVVVVAAIAGTTSSQLCAPSVSRIITVPAGGHISPPTTAPPPAGTRCTGGVSTPLQILLVAGLIAAVVAPIGVSIYLARRAGSAPARRVAWRT